MRIRPLLSLLLSTSIFVACSKIELPAQTASNQKEVPPVGELSISPNTSIDFGTEVTGSTSSLSFTLTNLSTIQIDSLVFSSLPAPFSMQTNCPSTIALNQNCTVTLSYAPQKAETDNASLGIHYSDGVSSQSTSVLLQGTAVAAGALVFQAGTTFSFGNVNAETSVNQMLTLQNSGQINITQIALSNASLAAPFSFVGGAYPGTGGTCATTVNEGSSCTIAIAFAPTAGGNFSSPLTLSYFEGSTTLASTITLTGTGVAPPPGTLDTTFGTNGIVTISGGALNLAHFYPMRILIQPDGKIVVESLTLNTSTLTVTISQFLTSGHPDTTFGTNGSFAITVPNVSTSDESIGLVIAGGLALQGTQILAAWGYLPANSSVEVATITRLNPNGTVDTTFGTNGEVNFSPPLPAGETDGVSLGITMQVQPSGMILIANGFSIGRFTPNGAVDTTFATNGVLTVPVGGPFLNSDRSIAVYPNGTFLVLSEEIGSVSNVLVSTAIVTRYTVNGTLDTTFGTNGVASAVFDNANYVFHSLSILSDSRIVTVGGSFSPTIDYTVVVFNADGTVSSTFGQNGLLLIPNANQSFGGSYAILPLANGNFWVGGTSNDNPVFPLNRIIASNGTIDPLINLSSTTTEIAVYDLAAQTNGQVVVGIANGNSYQLERFWP